ncbi:hypothetical protein [Psychroserpens luteolus]|uniref:hypothetical protein n=1 Tax=Psychroserpens luteolus TaxID=2855840 RepID=UPI001E28E61A|nr:hypothetical protein [Psychroserpens luteolus]MCD2260795.1 hypothetical protein [Psychroserpens luteolus]
MKRVLFFLVLICTFSACDDIIEVEDISQDTITVLAPTSNSTLAVGNVIFSWNDVQYAESYRLQLATPNFENASQILLDSTVTSTNFSKLLELGNYEWRVRAENSGFQTAYSTQNFTVEE